MEITYGALLMLGMFVAFVISQDPGKRANEVLLSRMPFWSRAGSAVSDWCSNAYGVNCRSSGTECKSDAPVINLIAIRSSPNTQGHSEFCVCKDGHERYMSGFAGERCRAVATMDPANAECEIEDDCSTYGENGGAVCRLELNKLVGRCACTINFIYDPIQYTCRAYDCSTDGDGKCREDLGRNAICNTFPGAMPVCACTTGTMMLDDPTKGGIKQCRDLTAYRCDNSSNRCPSSGANALYCDASGRCVCPRNMVVTAVPDTGVSECRSLTIGGIGCMTDKNCPENAFCQKSSLNTPGICLCKDYYRPFPTSGSSVVKCQLAVGTCCGAGSDCGEMRDPTGIPLACVRSAARVAANQSGVCLCQGVGTTAWRINRCSPAAC